MPKVFEGKERIDEFGRRILQCHTKGDKRFSPFCCYLKAFGRRDSIENFYQCAKVFASNEIVFDWRDAKRLQKAGIRQVAWQIGTHTLPVKPNEKGTSFAIDDWGIQWYVALWEKYLRLHPELLTIASIYDDFEDPFKGDFPMCQADVIRVVVREGIGALREYWKPLHQLLTEQQGIDEPAEEEFYPCWFDLIDFD